MVKKSKNNFLQLPKRWFLFYALFHVITLVLLCCFLFVFLQDASMHKVMNISFGVCVLMVLFCIYRFISKLYFLTRNYANSSVLCPEISSRFHYKHGELSRLNLVVKIASFVFPISYALLYYLDLLSSDWIYFALALPVLLILVSVFSKNRIHFNAESKSDLPDFATTIVLLKLAVFAFGLSYSVENFNILWLSILVLSFSLTLLFHPLQSISVNSDKLDYYIKFAGMLIVCFLYSIGVVKILNCKSDSSEPVVYNAVVINKEVSDLGRRKHHDFYYYAYLKSLTSNKKDLKFSVSLNYYQNISISDTVAYKSYKGFFGAEWLNIE